MRFGRRRRAAQLHDAVVAQDRQRVGKLVAAEVEVDGRDSALRTPLYLAVCRPDTEIIRMLVTAGADPNARTDFGGTPFCNALTSIGHRKRRDGRTAARSRCRCAADDRVLTTPTNLTASHCITRRSMAHLPLQDEPLEILLTFGSNVHARDHAGYTPLHAAAGSANPRAALALLEAGAGVDATDNRGDTPP